MSADAPLAWRQLHWHRPLDADAAVAVIRQWAADQRSPLVVLETRACGGRVTYLIGAHPAAIDEVVRPLRQLLAGTTTTPIDDERQATNGAGRLKASTRHRPLRTDHAESTTAPVLGALAQTAADEEVVLQLVLGPRRIPLAVPTNSPSSIVAPWWQVAWHGKGDTIDGEKRTALRAKVADHGFACTLRLGAVAATAARRKALLLAVLAGLRTGEAAGVRLRLVPERTTRIDGVLRPWRWPLRLNVQEIGLLSAWPVGDLELPGVPALHPRLLPPPPGTVGRGRVVASATGPGAQEPLRLSARDALHHLHVLGPTGTGKSTLLANLICQDIAAGYGVAVVEPKGDLVEEVLARVPAERQNDVVVLDPVDAAPVGLNPLSLHGRRPDVVADGVLAVFKQLYGTNIGPRSADILYASLLTLARRSDASLVMLPLLLTNSGFRRSLVAGLHDPLVLEPFWASFEHWSEGERANAVAPVMNKLRPLLRSNVRAVLGQRVPRFDVRQVFTERKVLLVPLRRGALGPEAAALLGSLVVAELWRATLGRTALPAAERPPVMVYIDEVQDFLRLPLDVSEALAQARGLSVGFTLAHQFMSQLSPELRAGVLANARSRVCFQLAHDDAVTIAKGHLELTAADLTALGPYEIYAALFARGHATPYASGRTLPLPQPVSDTAALRARSRERWGQPVDTVEAGFAELATGPQPDASVTGRRRRQA